MVNKKKTVPEKVKRAPVLNGLSVTSVHFDCHVQEHLSRSRDTKPLTRDAT